jgi:hypothetical protein
MNTAQHNNWHACSVGWRNGFHAIVDDATGEPVPGMFYGSAVAAMAELTQLRLAQDLETN